MKHFDRLYKTIMEEVSKTSKKTVIKESTGNLLQDSMKAISAAAAIIKRAMETNKDEVLEKLEEDVNYDSSCCAFEDYSGEGITREMWENSIKYGWMAETLPYFIDWQDYLFKNVEITPEESAALELVSHDAYVFSDEFEKGNFEGLDFCKEICSQFPVTIDPEELCIYFAGEDDDYAEESVKKPVSKKRVIKEHRAHRPSKRRVIKEEKYVSINSVEEYKALIEKAADIIKRAGNKGFDGIDAYVNDDRNMILPDILESDNVTEEQWDNVVKYGWIIDSFPLALSFWEYDRYWEDVITPEEKNEMDRFAGVDDQTKFINYFMDEFIKGNTQDLEWAKSIIAQFPGLDTSKSALDIYGANDEDYDDYDDESMPVQSVKKSISKRRIIKEHKVNRPSRRRVIKESAKRPVRHARKIKK